MKAILVLDEMPKMCGDCCMYSDRIMPGCIPSISKCCAYTKRGVVPDGGRADWCPLKELPEQRKTKDYEWTYALNAIFSDGINQGWNDCLKEIIGDEG